MFTPKFPMATSGDDRPAGLVISCTHTQHYLAKRGLARPAIPWNAIMALRAESKKK
jgi:hypothetical protein